MLKKLGHRLSALLCALAVSACAGFPVLAEDTLAPIEVIPPNNDSDYYLNMNFTAVPSGAWSGGGLAVDPLSGTWGRSSDMKYSAEHAALPLGWMQATPAAAITASGDYVFEADIMAPDLNFFSEQDGQKFDVIFGDVYVASIYNGGSMTVAGKAEAFTAQANTWYTVRSLLSLPSGKYKTEIIETSTSDIKAQGEANSGLAEINKLRVAQTKGATKPLYTQNWKFYKNDVGKASPVNPVPPKNAGDYYMNQSSLAAWSGGAEGDAVGGSWVPSNAAYDAAEDAVNLPGAGHFYAQVSGGANSAIKAGSYGVEQDFLFKSLGSTADAQIDPVTLQGQADESALDKKMVFNVVTVYGTAGDIKLFGTATGKTVTANQWYTFKQLIDLDKKTVEVMVIERKTGSVIARGKNEAALDALYVPVRVYHKSDDGFSLSGQNFKFYRNGQAADIPAAVFEDADGNRLSGIQTGEISVVPTIANTTGATLEGAFIIALYEKVNGENRLVCVESRDYSVCGSSPVVWTPNAVPAVTVPGDGKQYGISCFFWDGLQNMIPLAIPAELD